MDSVSKGVNEYYEAVILPIYTYLAMSAAPASTSAASLETVIGVSRLLPNELLSCPTAYYIAWLRHAPRS